MVKAIIKAATEVLLIEKNQEYSPSLLDELAEKVSRVVPAYEFTAEVCSAIIADSMTDTNQEQEGHSPNWQWMYTSNSFIEKLITV